MSEQAPPWHHLPPNPYNPHAWVIGDPDIGEECWIGAFTVIDGSGGLRIGAGCDISSGAQIYTHSTVKRALRGVGGPAERAPTEIGSNCHVGAGAIILMGATIGHHSVVAAGAVVKERTTAPPYSVLVGVPARILPGAAHRLRDDVNSADPEPGEGQAFVGAQSAEHEGTREEGDRKQAAEQ